MQPQTKTTIAVTAILASIFALFGVAGVTYQIPVFVPPATQPDGSTIGFNGTIAYTPAPASQPTSAPSTTTTAPTPPPPVVITTQPITPPVVTTQPTTGSAPVAATAPSQTYETDRWRKTFSYDANGFPQPPAVPPNAVWLSSPGAPGRLSTDCSDAQTAKNLAWANGGGSFYICVRDGSIFTNNQVAGTPGTWNCAIDIPGGTQTHPVVITRMGVNGYQDHSAPRPIILDQIYLGGHSLASAAGGGNPPLNYVEIFGLDFYADKRDPASPTFTANPPNAYQQYAVCYIDSGAGQSDHFLVSDCRVRYYMSGFDFDGTLNTQTNYVIKDVWIDHPVCIGCYGARFDGYDARVRDLFVFDPVFDVSGWNPTMLPKDGSGMEHCWYSDNKNEIAGVDPQHRFLGGIFCRPEAMGIKEYQGGLDDEDLFLACPIAAVFGDFNGYASNTVIDGDNSEFDPLTVAALNGTTQNGATTPGLALAQGIVLPTDAPGNRRGWGFEWAHSPGGYANTVAFTDKTDSINNGQAIQIQPLVAGFSGTFNFAGVILNGFPEGQFNAYSPHINASANGGPNIVPAVQTITCSGCVIPNFEGGYAGIVKSATLVDPTRNISTYAKSLGVAGVTNGPTWIARAEQNWSGSFDQRFTATAANAWILAGNMVKH